MPKCYWGHFPDTSGLVYVPHLTHLSTCPVSGRSWINLSPQPSKSSSSPIECWQCSNNRSFTVAEYSRDLEKDLMSETSGHFRRLCVSLSTVNKFHSVKHRDWILMSRWFTRKFCEAGHTEMCLNSPGALLEFINSTIRRMWSSGNLAKEFLSGVLI